MKIKKILLISFSPTRTSKSVIDAIASGLRDIPAETVDLTYPDALSTVPIAADELAIIGVPVYAGRVAPLAAKRLMALQGNNTPAVVVVTYGNREFEDALLELKDIVENAAFIPIAAGAFIGEHSFSGPAAPVAAGRPDPADRAAAENFGAKIRDKITALFDLATGPGVNVPGNRPYKDGVGSIPFTPKVIEEKCTQCGVCLSSCPSGAISLDSEIKLDQNLCIFCCACIKNCPEEAMIIDAEPIKQKRQWLHENCTERKSPKLFL